jgi:hypothetical protein
MYGIKKEQELEKVNVNFIETIQSWSLGRWEAGKERKAKEESHC